MMLQELSKWSKNQPQPKGLSTQEIDLISKALNENLKSSLPDGYMQFLKAVNGFSYNGYYICCFLNDDIKKNFPLRESMDLLDFNTRFYNATEIDRYLLLGKSSLDYIAYCKQMNKYVLMTNGTMSHLGTYDSFEDLIFHFVGLR